MKFVHITLAIFLLVLSVGMAFVLWDAHKLLQNANTDIVNLAATTQKMNDTLAAINAPCTGFHGSVTCGLLAQASQTTKNIGIVAGQSALQVKQTGVLVQATSKSLNTVAAHVNGEVDALHRTTDAATGLTVALTADALTANQTIAAGKPLLEASTATVQHFDALVSNPIWLEVGKNVVGMTKSGDLILADGSRVSKKFADDYTKKQTPWMRFWHYTGDTVDLLSWGARHD